jgi:hypothetical protein
MPEAPRPEPNEPVSTEPDATELELHSQEETEAAEERRRHGFFRRFVLRSLMWGLAILAGLVFLGGQLLNAPKTREWARQEIETRVSALLDREIKLDAVYFELVPLTVRVEGLVIGGGPDFPDNPFLVLPRGEVEADLEIFSRRRLRIRQIRLEQPKLDLRFTAAGDNIIGGGKKGGEKAELDISIGRVEIERGEVRLDEEQIELSFVAEGLEAQLDGLGSNHLKGDVAIPRIALSLPKAEPVELALVGKVELTTERVGIQEATITGNGLELVARGGCDWSNRGGQGNKCDLETRGRTEGALLARLGYFDELEGELAFDGRFSWRGAVGWRGRITSERLGFFNFVFQDLEGQLAADRFGIRLGLLGAGYAGGNLHGDVAVDLSTPEDRLTVEIEADGVEVDPLFADLNIPVKGLASTAHGRMSFGAPMRRVIQGNGEGLFEIRAAPAAPGVPFEGTVPLRIESGVLRLGSVSLQAPRHGLLAGGFYDLDSNQGRLNFEVATSDAAEVVDLVMGDRAAAPADGEGDDATALWKPTQGIGRAVVLLELAPGSFRVGLDLDLEQVSTGQIAAVDVQGSLELTPGSVENLRLDLSKGGSALTVAGRVPFASERDPIDLKIDAFSWPLAEAKPLLPFALPVDGPVSGHLEIKLAGGKTSGSLDAHVAPALVEAANLRIDNLEAHLAWDPRRMLFHEVVAQTPAGVLRGGGSFDLETEQLDLKLRGAGLDIAAAPFAGYRPGIDLAGRLTVEANIQGTLQRPRIQLATELAQVELDGRPLEGTSRLGGWWDGQKVNIEGVLLDAVQISGGGALDMENADLQVEVAAADLSQITRLLDFEPGYPLGGEIAGRLQVKGPLAEPEVQVALGKTRFHFGKHVLVGSSGSRVRFAGGAWQLSGIEFREEGSDGFLRVGGRADSQGGLAFEVAAKLGADWLELVLGALAPDLKLRPQGQVSFEGTIAGPLAAPAITGRADLEGIDMVVPGIDEGLRGLNGTILFTPGHVDLGRLEGNFAGGRIAVTGQADLPQAAAEGPAGSTVARPFSYGLQLSGRGLGLRSVQGWAVSGNLDLTLRSVERGHFLGGRADVESFTFRREIKLDVATLLRDFLRKQRLQVQPAGSNLATFQLNVEVRADNTVRINNNLADLRGSANFNLRGTLAAPLVYGEMSVEPGGKLVYNDAEYLIERGRLIFADPFKIDPEIDLVAQTRVREFDISLAIFGTLNRLETRFTSQPPLPDVDVFRLLAEGDFGSTDDPALTSPTRTPGEAVSLSAATFLYGQAASAIGERVSNLFGLDKFRVDPLVGAGGDNLSAARVTVGKRLSRRLSLTYSVDPSTTESQRLQVEWRLTEGLVLVLTQNGDSTYSADARWDTTF